MIMTTKGRREGREGKKEKIYRREEQARRRHSQLQQQQQQQQQQQEQVSSFFQFRRNTARVHTTLRIRLAEKCKGGLFEGTKRKQKARTEHE